MAMCFVIQPFDSGRFDKRFDDVFKPALEQAGIEPYRVDRDPQVEVPIDSIEKGIRNATICLADITTDNPNVWYELGYAFAAGRSVIMVCSDERATSKFPFDIQHRAIIRYGSESLSDFNALIQQIVERAEALKSGAETKKLIENEQVAPTEGVSRIEIHVLSLIATESVSIKEPIAVFSLKHRAESAGLTGIGYSLALRRLQKRGFVDINEETDREGDSYSVVVLQETGWNWIDSNESLFMLRKDKPAATRNSDITDDDIPF